MTVQDIRSKVEQLRGQETQLQKSLENAKARLADNEDSLQDHEQAREVIKEAGLKTQESLAFHISDITSLALKAVFPDPYDLDVEFVERRNKTECDLLFSRDGEQIDPIDASGGGAIDVAAFALRVASWSMKQPRTRNCIILDEPMRFLSADLQDKASAVIKELSDKLNLQFIIITHEEELTTASDKVFQVSKSKGVSTIKAEQL
jgi:DNA repair exonuclease SbcCD ATPase subunit